MTQIKLRAAATTLLMAAVSLGSAQAQNYQSQAPARFQPDGSAAHAQSYDRNVAAASAQSGVQNAAAAEAQPPLVVAGSGPVRGPALMQVAPGYPYLNAPLYTCPRQDIPYQMGGTVITNQALFPHEMLYAHEYKAMYPPFYYRAKGGYIWTPFGIHSHERWQLQGTVVKVKYHSHYAPFSAFHPPLVR